ncbi:phosphatidylinositol-3,5-bisphosphate 3-phosphatase MTMR8 isoform X2 [Microcebus murinus]|uniref:phosphatidylinositol-3,5-bisphosphate 3-phosphatase MTMR8 isoform X2 n=1 Tax=Microcebus murinus TaxID=30608 RepID=UPI000642CF91|nr:myotubularin-related protein 8 isoform X2 [Microcebus murinus]
MDLITVPKVENVKLLDRYVGKKPANGILYLTATHLIYVEASGAARKETWIALHHIATVEKLPITSLGCPLTLRCKNFRVAHFVLDSDLVCHEVYISLLKLSQPELPEDLYAFSYNPKSSKEMREIGWKLIDPVSDFGRMGIPNRYWTITDANRNYEICNTYPPEIVVPKSVTLGTVVGSSKFRSKERVPVLSYLYKENNAAICRCSQPLSGFYTRCVDDELLLEAISQTNPGSQFMYVVDTRPKLNAMANRAAGKGYENEDNYANIRFRFMGIENIHVMRSSLQKLLEVCELKTPTMSEFLSGLESSGWLRHIKAIMDAGIFITKAVKVEKASVLVHCSDGWDRTAQVCSVASILLDPFYRTFKGLMILIEKEWISMGHKFSQRCGHLDGDSKEVSPIFTQFLDCIWQLMEQFPCAFEFNENFLLEIHDHVFSCQFGNFLGNCQKDREDLRVYEKTHSVWPFLVQRKPDFRNPLYKGFTMYGVLNPSTVPYNIQFWCGMYNRFDKGLQPKQSMLESLLEIKKQRAMLEADVHELEKKLKTRDEPPEEVCTCSQLGNLFSQHLGSPLSNPLGFMGIDGDLNTLMENGTLSREGGLRAQMDQVKSQCADLHHDCCGTVGSLRAINISGDVGISGDTGISEARGVSGNMDIFEAMGFSGDMGISGATSISEVTGISGNMGISEARGFSGDTGISEASDFSRGMSFSGAMTIFEDIGISKASTKDTGCSKQQ